MSASDRASAFPRKSIASWSPNCDGSVAPLRTRADHAQGLRDPPRPADDRETSYVVVHLFELLGHPKAEHAYAWSTPDRRQHPAEGLSSRQRARCGWRPSSMTTAWERQ